MTGGRPPIRSRLSSDRGAAAVLVMTSVLAVVAAAGAVLMVAGAISARHRAAAAADAAALAAAAAVDGGPVPACAAALRLAVADSARLVSCRVLGAEVTVVVVTPVSLPPGLLRAEGQARAGPAETNDQEPGQSAGRS